MLSLLHKIAAHPWFYDVMQKVAGQQKTFHRLEKTVQSHGQETVMEVGGGTGIWRKLWPNSCRYVCMDIEMPKLLGFRSKTPDGLAILCDAARMAVASGAVDVVTCIAVAHHLSDTMLDDVFEETARVLKAGGKLILVDPVLSPSRVISRVLWRLDRGSYPRRGEDLRRRLEQRFDLAHWEEFAIYHEYIFGIGVRR